MADYDVNAQNKGKDTRKIKGTGIASGVESGVSMVESMPRGVAPQQMQTEGNGRARNKAFSESATKGGMNFKVGVG